MPQALISHFCLKIDSDFKGLLGSNGHVKEWDLVILSWKRGSGQRVGEEPRNSMEVTEELNIAIFIGFGWQFEAVGVGLTVRRGKRDEGRKDLRTLESF